jgi:hypothetical protein
MALAIGGSPTANRAPKNQAGERGGFLPFRNGGVMADQHPKEVDKDKCVELLSHIAPVSERLARLLELPEMLYLLSDSPSFSSSKNMGESAGRVATHLIFATPMPDKLAGYGLHIDSRGSNVFCTLVDKKRKIIVHATVNSAFSKTGKGDWRNFQFALKCALATAKNYKTQGKEFAFVMQVGKTMTLME